MSEIAIIGGGAWGTGLAIALGRKGTHRVRMWVYEKEVCDSINQRHENEIFLRGQRIPEAVRATNSLQEALRGAEIVVSVMPSHHVRRVFREMQPHLGAEMLFVSATKGLENETLLRVTEVIREVLGVRAHDTGAPSKPGFGLLGWRGFDPRIAALSGPSFAQEVARGDPTAITIASRDAGLAQRVQADFSDPSFRVYTNDDVTGVEMGGALKNIIAIAAGVCNGLGLGHNSVAALITRGLAEITRLAVASGARRDTMAGLSGMGDLVLTCTGGLSRNRTVGVELGRGRKLSEIIAGMHGMVAEGVLTTNAAVDLACKSRIEMPITQQMHAILHQGKPPRDAIHELMTRPGKGENL